MSEFIYSKSDFETRPVDGYTYIYIYSLDNLYLYVGQTVQSIEGRYRNHLSDNSGAHYANNIAYFQIKNEYANYAEGYIAGRIHGICQGNVPNPDHHRDNIPKDVRRILQLIGNKLVNRKDYDKVLKAGDLPLFSIIIDNDGSQKETLAFFSMLLKENKTIGNHYHNMKHLSCYQNELYITEIQFSDGIDGYLISRPKGDYRPILFMKADTVAKIQFVKDIISNFPIYCIVNGRLYDKHKDRIERLFSCNQTGLMVQYTDKIETIFAFHKNFRAIYKAKQKISLEDYTRGLNKDFVRYCTLSSYKAKFTPYHYYQCA